MLDPSNKEFYSLIVPKRGLDFLRLRAFFIAMSNRKSNRRKDQPYIPIYVMDWQTDEKLAYCSAKAHGILLNILFILHKSDTYGKVSLIETFKNKDDDICLQFAKQFARRLPFDLLEISEGLTELKAMDVIQISSTTLSQKRMIKDAEISLKRAASGAKGGASKSTSKSTSKKKANNKQNAEIEYDIENEIDIDNNSDLSNFYDLTKKEDKDIVFPQSEVELIGLRRGLTINEMKPAFEYWLLGLEEKNDHINTIKILRNGFERYLINSKDRWKKPEMKSR